MAPTTAGNDQAIGHGHPNVETMARIGAVLTLPMLEVAVPTPGSRPQSQWPQPELTTSD
jgi:hypothetical protein